MNIKAKTLKTTVAVMAALLIATCAASFATAKTFVCDQQVCTGTSHKDHITGTSLSQTISGGKKGDTITDTARGDNDDLKGGSGNDRLDTQEGRNGPNEKDVVDGGPGYDQCIVDKNDDAFNCEVVVRS